MKVIVLTPDRELYSGEGVQAVLVPGVSGSFEILQNHAPIVSALGAGKVVVKTADGTSVEYAISQGFVEVIHNEVSVLVHASVDA